MFFNLQAIIFSYNRHPIISFDGQQLILSQKATTFLSTVANTSGILKQYKRFAEMFYFLLFMTSISKH